MQAIAATADTAQLDLLLEGDNLDSDDEAMFNEYRAKRMAMMRKEEKRGRFGTMEPLAREDFVREVTEGSKSVAPGDEEEGEGERDVLEKYAEGSGSEDEREEEQGKRKKGDGLFRKDGKLRGTGVVVFLFKDSYVDFPFPYRQRWQSMLSNSSTSEWVLIIRVPLSQHLRPLLVRLAAAHPASKFLSIPAGLCIPNYPDKNVPTLLVYRNGEMLGQVVAGMGLNGMRTTVKGVSSLSIPVSSPAILREAGSRFRDEGRLGALHGICRLPRSFTSAATLMCTIGSGITRKLKFLE